MPAPSKRILAEAMAPHLGKVPHALTPTTQAICCLRSRLPQRLEHAQGVLRGKLGNRLAADGGAVIVARLFSAAVLGHHLSQPESYAIGRGVFS